MINLDGQYTEEELRNSPYYGMMRDAVVGGSPDEYRSGPTPFAAPIGYGSDRHDNASEFAREQAELAQYSIGAREVMCTSCNMVHRRGACDR